jgi:UDP-N-acetylmuramoylalanine--D-glutamate ligase
MESLENKQVLVVGLSASGRAACRLLRDRGAHVTAIDSLDIPELREVSTELRAMGVAVELGILDLPRRIFDLAVISPEISDNGPFLQALKQTEIPIIGELELGYQQSLCLNIAISGTNGKTSTADLIARILARCQRKTLVAGSCHAPICDVVDETRELDFLTIEASAFQLARTKFFRPSVAVLLNISQDHVDHFSKHADYLRAKARLFTNQQSFDWAIVQSEAWAQMRALDLPMPGKVITFSAKNRRADLFLDRGLIISRIDGWAGPLLNLDECEGGLHHAENFMAVLAVGRVLRLPLEEVTGALKKSKPLPHRFQMIAEISGVKFINDSKSTNLDALRHALLSLPGERGEPNVWLIAGGKEKGLEYHDIGPLLSQRVKGAFLIGESREKLRASWSLFTPCTMADSLLIAVSQAAEKAVRGDVVLLSPACSSFDQFQNYQHRGELFCSAVETLAGTSCSGGVECDRNIKGRVDSREIAQSVQK